MKMELDESEKPIDNREVVVDDDDDVEMCAKEYHELLIESNGGNDLVDCFYNTF